MPFFQLSGTFLARRDFDNITFDFVWIFPIYVTKIFHKIKTSVKKFSKVLKSLHPIWARKGYFGQNTCHVLELGEKIN